VASARPGPFGRAPAAAARVRQSQPTRAPRDDLATFTEERLPSLAVWPRAGDDPAEGPVTS
jgi:hypothetical protein